MTHTAIDRVYRAVKAATGDDYGDGELVAYILDGYAEPGYHGDIVVLGNWNDHTVWNRELNRQVGRTDTKADTVPSRLANILENIPGVTIEWSDEWTGCCDCHKAIRTSADSYSWTPSYLWCDDGYVCATCAKRDPNAYLEDYVNDSDKAVTWLTPSELSEAGWTQWRPGNEQTYENGWHPGQTDDPPTILAEIQGETMQDVVFLIESVGQFDMRFSAWTRDETI